MAALHRPGGPEPEDFVHTRRAVAGLFFAGYALASVSAAAEPTRTSAEGLVTGEVKISIAAGAQLPAYVARPKGRGRHPVVLVVSEVFGVHEYIRDVCRRLAKLGYVAVAPAFFFRAGDPAPLTDFAEVRKIVETATHEQVMDDIAATLRWAEGQKFADARRIAITGFCWGGAVVWMAAARFPQIKAGAAWYGKLTHPAPDGFLGKEERPWPVDVAGELKAPVLGLYAGEDKGIPPSDIEAMRTALKAAGRRDEIVVYPGVQHGFHADYRDSYDKAAAESGWARMLAHFRANGVPPGAA
ncbi:MAG TPA: dienelactone hydrolase family protein [Caulobacteraceae bacterium]|jgi:carboxymethylenebutenolidase